MGEMMSGVEDFVSCLIVVVILLLCLECLVANRAHYQEKTILLSPVVTPQTVLRVARDKPLLPPVSCLFSFIPSTLPPGSWLHLEHPGYQAGGAERGLLISLAEL